MTDYPVKQIKPNHATHLSHFKEKFITIMLNDEHVIAQPKYDGERMLIHFDHGNVYCTSRRHSKKTDRFMENQDKLADLCEVGKDFPLNYTVLDCECYSKDWSTIAGILHSLPERAAELSKVNPPKFAVFDCLFYDGEDLRDEPYFKRLGCMVNAVKLLRFGNAFNIPIVCTDASMPYLSSIDRFEDAKLKSIDDVKAVADFMIGCQWEGIVIKSLSRTYYEDGASIKVKRFETVDCVVCDFEYGNGKYSDTVGALHVGYYDPATDTVVKISNVNCGTDEERNMWRDQWSELKNSVIEVKCQQITSRSLRHPVYLRLRKDKDYKMCTRDTIFKEN